MATPSDLHWVCKTTSEGMALLVISPSTAKYVQVLIDPPTEDELIKAVSNIETYFRLTR